MKKIIVIGCPGSGKSCFSRKLHKKTNIPLYHLDMLFWNEDKTTVSKEIFLERLQEIMRKPEWIIDGNYGSSMEMRMQECDTVFFLDYPVEVCIDGVNARKGQERSDMPWYEKVDEEDSEFIGFIKNYNCDSRPKVISLLEKYSSKNIIIFENRDDSDMYLNF